MAQKVLAITISSDWIKIAEEMYTQKGIQVYGAYTVATPEGSVDDGNITNIAAVAGAIEAELVKNEIGCRNVIFSMQSSRIANKEVMTPALREPKLSTYIKTNATEYFPVNIDDYILTYSVLETVDTEGEGKQHRAMVVAAPAGMVQNYYDLAKACGLTVTAIDYVGNSNLQITRLQIDEKPSIIIQIGEESTIVSIMSNNLLRLMRTVPYGKSTVVTALMEKKDSENFDEEEAYRMLAETEVIQSDFSQNEYVTDSLRYLVNNISRVMDYYIGKNPEESIEKAYILTEGSGIKGIDKLFHNELNGVEVKLITNLVDVDLSESMLNESNVTLYLTNIGAVIDPVNFIPAAALEAVKAANTGKYFRILFYVAIAAAILIVGIPALSYMNLKSTNDDLELKIKNLAWVQETVDAYYDAMNQYEDASQFAALTTNEDDDLLDFVEFLEESMPSDISIGSFSVSDGSVTLSCTGASKNSVAQFLLILSDQENISDVYCPSVSESKDSEGVITISFSVTLQFTEFAEESEATTETETEAETATETETEAETATETETETEAETATGAVETEVQ